MSLSTGGPDDRQCGSATTMTAARDPAAVPPIRLAIIDDHPVVRDGTAALLARVPGIELVGVAGSIDEAGPLLDAEVVDVVLLDIRLGTDSGLRLLDESDPTSRPPIVVLTAYDYPQYAAAALRL